MPAHLGLHDKKVVVGKVALGVRASAKEMEKLVSWAQDAPAVASQAHRVISQFGAIFKELNTLYAALERLSQVGGKDEEEAPKG